MSEFDRERVIEVLGAAAAKMLGLHGAGLTPEQQGAQGIREIFDRDPEIDPLLAIVACSGFETIAEVRRPSASAANALRIRVTDIST